MSFDFNAKPKHHWLIHMAQTSPSIYLWCASRAVLKFNTGSVAEVGVKPPPLPGGAGLVLLAWGRMKISISRT